jgi:osmotically-inducible protein OsmY
MKSDTQLKKDIEDELLWSPDVDETDIAVKVTDGVAALSGYVHSYAQKYQAEAAVKRVAGVAGVANDIEVRLISDEGLSDPEIARSAVNAIKEELPITSEGIKVLVQGGRVTLEGKAQWQYQKERAQQAVRPLRGVKSVINLIDIAPKVEPKDIKRKIQSAFQRNAQIDSNQVSVEADGATVTLKGRVRSWAERQQAQDTAWCAPGVKEVKNEITVGA